MNVDTSEVMQSEPLWERVVSAMRLSIVLGDLSPGAHLKEPLLAQRFGVSRLPVREAIAQLEREGLVRVEPRRGAFVVGISSQDISDMYECRVILESHALVQLAEGMDTQGVASLGVLIDHMNAAVRAGHAQGMAASDMAFHRLLVVLSGNRALLSAWEPLAPLLQTLLTNAELPLPRRVRVVEDHRAMLRALENHDADTAEAILGDHLTSEEQLVVTTIGVVRERRDARMSI